MGLRNCGSSVNAGNSVGGELKDLEDSVRSLQGAGKICVQDQGQDDARGYAIGLHRGARVTRRVGRQSTVKWMREAARPFPNRSRMKFKNYKKLP